MAMPLFPLAADWVELIAKGIPALLFIFWLISQAIGEAQARPNKPRPRPRPVPPAGRAKPPGGRGDELDEMEAFLRRAAEQRAGGAESDAEILGEPRPASRGGVRTGGPARATPSRTPKPAGGAEKEQPRRLVKDALPRVSAHDEIDRQTAERKAELAAGAGGKGLASRHEIGDRSFEEQTSHLGEHVAEADDRLASRLQRAFDHPVGSLVHEYEQQTPDTASPTAEAIAKMLSSPETMRQAVVLNEILRRPVE